MLNKKRSGKLSALRGLVIVPLLVFFVFLFHVETRAQVQITTKGKEVVQNGERIQVTLEKTATEATINNYIDLVAKFECEY